MRSFVQEIDRKSRVASRRVAEIECGVISVRAQLCRAKAAGSALVLDSSCVVRAAKANTCLYSVTPVNQSVQLSNISQDGHKPPC